MYQTLPAEKKIFFFFHFFFRFSLAFIDIENDDEVRKQNFSKPSQQKQNEKFFIKYFFRFSLAVIAIENDDEG